MNINKMRTVNYQEAGVSHNEGLRQYMLGVYNFLSVGLLITAIISFVAANTPAITELLYTRGANGAMQSSGLGLIVSFAPLALILYMSFAFNKLTASSAKILYFVFCSLMGLSLSYVFLMYTGHSITKVFFITSASFAGLSLYGYTTKKDLSGFRTFLIMGLIGLLIAGIVNIFLQSSMLHFVYSVAGVIIFAGFTAYDTQSIKNLYYQTGNDRKVAIMGALKLYLDFINLFVFLLQFLGDRR